MKLATLKNAGRDGRLVVVSRDLTQMTDASFLARTLQAALDDWSRVAPHLETLAESLERGSVPSERFHENDAASPLPRAYGRMDGSAYPGHSDLTAKGGDGAATAGGQQEEPLIRQRSSDGFLGPRDPIRVANEAWGIDMGGGLAIALGDVSMGADPQAARAAIRLVMLVNDVSLRDLPPGSGPLQSRPCSAFSPVAVTPDELGEAWDGAKLNLPLIVDTNGKPFGRANAGVDMTFDFATLASHAARTRPLSAGTIIGSGTVSDSRDGGRPVAGGGAGTSCIAELRALETIRDGSPTTPFLRFGDTVRIEMKDAKGHSIFGAIEQTVEQYQPA